LSVVPPSVRCVGGAVSISELLLPRDGRWCIVSGGIGAVIGVTLRPYDYAETYVGRVPSANE
jgi:hypothetical protein